MLVVTRTKGESLMLGDDIEVQVVEIRGDKVRLGVVCPVNVPVHRREVLDLIERQPLRKPTEPDAKGSDDK